MQIFALVVNEVVDQRFASCMVARPHVETNTTKRQLGHGISIVNINTSVSKYMKLCDDI